MKAWTLNEPGNIDNLSWEEIELPEVTESRLIIKVVCTALNPELFEVVLNL